MKAYLDYAATTPVYPEVVKAMAPFWRRTFGNPSSVHSWGQEARMAIDQARGKIAQLLGCSPREIVFTGTTTTSTNLAILGSARARKKPGAQVITSLIEHHAASDPVKQLGKEGFKTVFLPVDKNGLVDLKALEKSINKKTVLVTIMYANNEVGTIQPIRKISQTIRKKEKQLKTRIYFHVDAATAVGWLNIKPAYLGADLISFGAHKFGGPKGVGMLYLKQGTEIEPITFGGAHEYRLWPGTEPVSLIVGLAKAMEISLKRADKVIPRIKKLQKKLIKGMEKVEGVSLVGSREKRLPDIASFLVEGVEGEAMLLLLSDQGIAASSGSACTSGELKPSHVLLAMGVTPEKAHGSIRFSLGPETKEEEIDYVLKIFPPLIAKLRQLRKGIK